MCERNNLVDMIKKYDEKAVQLRQIESKQERSSNDLDNALERIQENNNKINIFEDEKLDLQKKLDFERNKLVQEEKYLKEKVTLFQ